MSYLMLDKLHACALCRFGESPGDVHYSLLHHRIEEQPTLCGLPQPVTSIRWHPNQEREHCKHITNMWF